MSLIQLVMLSAAALLCGALGRWRTWGLLVTSLLAVFWLQSATPVRFLDFWMGATSLILTALTWFAIQPDPARRWKLALPGAGATAGVIVALALTRYLRLGYGEAPFNLLPSRPPDLLWVLAFLAAAVLLALASLRWIKTHKYLATALVGVLMALFLVLKIEPLGNMVSAWLRALNGQPISLASALDLRWLGYSYIAFRLLHVLQDQRSGRLPEISYPELMIYVLFFPSLSAGPIDRVQHFMQELRRPFQHSVENFLAAAERLASGIARKYLVADTLALAALNPVNAGQLLAGSGGWTWLLLYAYALRIYFDFSGYTDIAIGLGLLSGLRLPENFARPYLKSNLTQFWNSWHITLAQWFRAYFFNPLTRTLRGAPKPWPMPWIIFLGQMGVMLLIGLWHGFTWNFVIWGAWHGLGLFIHNRWSEWMRTLALGTAPLGTAPTAGLEQRPWLKRLVTLGGWFLTFHFVALGWVWFALPTPELSWRVLQSLFGW